ncbi:MAG: outer membrane lipoprotein carrier protein LolA [Deltaproteobacteria bacterium]
MCLTSKRSIILIGHLILAMLFMAGTVQAAPTPVEIAERLQKQYEEAKSFSADFSQKTTLQLGDGRTRRGAGSVVIQRPGEMRWDYTSPDPQVIICDGKTITIYLEKSKQLMIGDAREYLQSDITYAFFTGTGDILKDFIVTAPEDGQIESDGSYRITLTPKKPHPHVAKLTVTVDQKTFLIKELLIADHFGSLTRMTFSNLQLNRKYPVDFFHITPPPGTEIIKN